MSDTAQRTWIEGAFSIRFKVSQSQSIPGPEMSALFVDEITSVIHINGTQGNLKGLGGNSIVLADKNCVGSTQLSSEPGMDFTVGGNFGST